MYSTTLTSPRLCVNGIATTFSVEARAKWDAWEGRKGMSAEEAKNLYVEEWEKQKADYMPKE